jgi:D-serine deaminase-like pyridoxal phosphate-dependent protein
MTGADAIDRTPLVDWRTKGFWLPGSEQSVLGCGLFDGPFTWPVMAATGSAIDANIATMARYCAAHGVDHAPHGKTTMAPSLFAAQLAAGAWGITVATANQALVARRFGVPRVLFANELFDAKVLRWAVDEVASGWEFLCYVDSLAGVAVARDAVAGSAGRLRLLVEIGFPGGRTGCRSVAEAVAVARAVATADGLDLAGVAAFEGLLPDPAAVHTLLADVAAAAEQTARLCPEPPIVTAGGSMYFDLVVAELREVAARCGGRLVLRSGAVVSHDDGVYAAGTPFHRVPAEGALAAALQVWAQVLATPEPGLSIVGAGKRDLPFDEGLPVPLRVRTADGAMHPLPDARVERLNDQHAYVRGAPVHPGELMHLGISHPCTAFDKWRVIPVVDDDYRVVDLIHTYF